MQAHPTLSETLTGYGKPFDENRTTVISFRISMQSPLNPWQLGLCLAFKEFISQLTSVRVSGMYVELLLSESLVD